MFQNTTLGLFNIVVGKPGNAQAESEVLEDVGSYGKQIGRIADALDVLIATLDRKQLTDEQAAAIYAFKDQIAAVRAVKSKTTNRDYPDLSKPPVKVLCVGCPLTGGAEEWERLDQLDQQERLPENR
jgi:hypothetical protein